MAIHKIKIENFKIFEGVFELEFNQGINILVGDNEVGKSTVIEAIHLVLTGMINGKYLNTELTQYLFNNNVVNKYIQSIADGKPMGPPAVKIELYFEETNEVSSFMGGINSDRNNNAYGISFSIELTDTVEYAELLKTKDIKTLPIEYYEAKWASFADKILSIKSIPIKSALVDSSLARFQNGSDIYISRIVRQGLEPNEVVKVAQAHRYMRESFMEDDSIKEINEKIQSGISISQKKIALSVELLSKNAWENSLMTYVDDVPFHYIGKGEQCVIKTRLALADKKAKNASVILMEEPENHLTHTRLSQLIDVIVDDCDDRQIILSTHSSFVANKLGLDHLILLGKGVKTKFSSLTSDTADFFKKLAGYDTLRMVLAKKAILVEGDSDELIVQKAYMATHEGKLPIEDGIDVISVGTSFLRFLQIAAKLKKQVAVVTDNDGDINGLKRKYADYIDGNKKDEILISYDKNDHTPEQNPIPKYNYNTLENLLLLSNGSQTIQTVLNKSGASDDELRLFMKGNKTSCALSIFEYTGSFIFPSYITEAIDHVQK